MIYVRFMPHACQSVLKKKSHGCSQIYLNVDITTNVIFQAFSSFVFKKEAHVLSFTLSLLHSDITQTRDIPEIVLWTYSLHMELFQEFDWTVVFF